MSTTENFQKANGAGDIPAMHALTMSSGEIAALTGKRHGDVIRDVKTMLAGLYGEKGDTFDMIENDDAKLRHLEKSVTWHRDARGYIVSFGLDKEHTLTLVAGYEVRLRQAIIRRWMELEAQIVSAELAAVASLRADIAKLTGMVTELAILNDPRRAALEYASVCELLTESGALPKGRNSLNRRVGYDLKLRALKTVANEDPSPVRRAAHTGTWLYKRDFAERYMRERGLGLVESHNAKVTGGQGVIPFPDRRTKAETPQASA